MAMSLPDSGPDFDDGVGAYRPLAEINVTPFVDVMLVLLVIFMVAAPLMMAAVPLDLPRTRAAPLGHPPKPIVVSVTKDGDVFVGEEAAPADRLVPFLVSLRGGDPDAVVLVRGDRGLAYGRIMEVMGQIGQAGFTRVSLIAEAARN